ncbi:hypothetical protein NUACC21_44720 [Scytonema sp. NUACC21]
MITLQLFLLALTALILTFTLGYISLRAVTNLTVKECLALAGGWGMALQGAIAFIGFLLSLSERHFFLLMTLGLLTIFVVLFLQKNISKEAQKLPIHNLKLSGGISRQINSIADVIYLRQVFHRNYSWLYPLIGFWLTLVGIQLCIPLYSGGGWFGDWWYHYDIARVYLGKQATDTMYFGYMVTSRTPLFNLFISYYLELFGDQFNTYQLISTLPGFFLLTTIPLLIGSKQVTLAMTLVALNPYINNVTIFPWPKILTTLYIIAGIYFYLDIRKTTSPTFFTPTALCCGMSLGLAILSHPSALIYVGVIVVDNIWLNRRSFTTLLSQLGVPLLIAFTVLLPWVLWGINEYGVTTFFHSASNTVGNTTISNRLIDAVKNALFTLEPYLLFDNFFNINDFLHINTEITYIGKWDSWLLLYYDILPGALTFTISSLLIFKGIKQFLKKVPLQSILPNSLLWGIIIIGFWGGCILQPGTNSAGIVGESMTPIVFVMLLVATEYLYTLPVQFKQFILLMVAGEFLDSRGIHLAFLAMGSPIVWDENIVLKVSHNLVFSRDLIGNSWAILIVVVGILISLMMGLKDCLSYSENLDSANKSS